MFLKFVCQNERIWTLGGGMRRASANVDPPMLNVNDGWAVEGTVHGYFLGYFISCSNFKGTSSFSYPATEKFNINLAGVLRNFTLIELANFVHMTEIVELLD